MCLSPVYTGNQSAPHTLTHRLSTFVDPPTYPQNKDNLPIFLEPFPQLPHLFLLKSVSIVI